MNWICRRNACLPPTVRFIVRAATSSTAARLHKSRFSHGLSAPTPGRPCIPTIEKRSLARKDVSPFLNFHGTPWCSRASLISGNRRVLSCGFLPITRYLCANFDGFNLSLYRYLSFDFFFLFYRAANERRFDTIYRKWKI